MNRWADAGRRVKAARIASHLIDEATAYARDSGLNPTIPQAAWDALGTLAAHGHEDEAWRAWSRDAGCKDKVPSHETQHMVRDRLLSIAEAEPQWATTCPRSSGD